MMSKHLPAFLAFLLLHGIFCLPTPGEEASQPIEKPVTITPEQTDEILANPGMGWETFHRSNRHDRNLPSWIPSTVYYIRWGWGELEPRPGQINHDLLDRVLKESHDSGQKLAFRVMCCSTTRNEPYHPGWLNEVGGKELIADYRGTAFPIADFDDPITLQRHIDFIKRLGERYDGHPDIAHVDIGSIGWWGEWHLSGSQKNKMPSLENRTKVIDAYLAAFKKTPLLMLIGDGPCLKYATEHGAGWRADCLGDMGGFSKNWYHMRDSYPVSIKESGIQDVWKTAPVAWETCWDMRKWVDEGWSLRYIFNYALALHASYINNKSAPLPSGDNVRPGAREIPAQAGLSACAQGAKAFFECQAWSQAGSAHEVAEHRLRSLLQALPTRLPSQQRSGLHQGVRLQHHGQPLAARLDRTVHRGVFQGAERPAPRRGGRRDRHDHPARGYPRGRLRPVLGRRGGAHLESRGETGDQGTCQRRMVSGERDQG